MTFGELVLVFLIGLIVLLCEMSGKLIKDKDCSASSLSGKHQSSSQGKAVKNKPVRKNWSECNVTKSNNYADVRHKTNGNSNWAKFTKDHNISSIPLSAKNSVLPSRTKESHPQVNGYAEYSNGHVITKVLAIDCEMVGIGESGRENMLARVSVVNSRGECLYDTFVKPRETIVDYRTAFSGVRPKDVENGKDFDDVQRDIATLLSKKIVVGHSLKSDFSVLFLNHPKHLIRDTSKFFKEPGKGTPSLKKLALTHLGTNIQGGEHSSVEDAQAAMHIYNLFKKFWERGSGNKNRNSYSVYLRECRAKMA